VINGLVAGDIRLLEARLSGLATDLRDDGLWQGMDSDTFQREWNDNVRGPLLRAASKLDGVSTTSC
jgi:hypothetical protein